MHIFKKSTIKVKCIITAKILIINWMSNFILRKLMNKISYKTHSSLIHKAGHCYHVENCDYFSILKDNITSEIKVQSHVSSYLPVTDDSCFEVQQPEQASYCLLCKDPMCVPEALCRLLLQLDNL